MPDRRTRLSGAFDEPGGRGWIIDAAIAAGLTLASTVILAGAGLLSAPRALPGVLATLAFTALVAGRRRWPVILTVVAGVLAALPEYTPDSARIEDTAGLTVTTAAALFIYGYTLGSERAWKLSLVGLIPLTVGAALSVGRFNPLVEMVTVGPWLAGLAVASRRRIGHALEARARELEEEREVFAAESVRYERARIARELHDIVAHCVSLMVVQASAGEHLSGPDPRSADEAFASISEAAEQASAEIDRLVALLDSSTPAVPPTGLRIVEELVRRVRASGLSVSCQLTGDLDDVAEGTAETVHRLVQEAITNAMKHAPAAAIDVALVGGAGGSRGPGGSGSDSDVIEVEVVNGRPSGPPSGLETSGGAHGLAGMRERVDRCGGRFEAGPTPYGGWRVAASLPRHPAIAASGDPAIAAPGLRAARRTVRSS